MGEKMDQKQWLDSKIKEKNLEDKDGEIEIIVGTRQKVGER